MKIVEIVFFVVGVGISQILPARLNSSELNIGKFWQFLLLLTIVVSSILLFFLYPIFEEIPEVYTFEFIGIGILLVATFFFIYFAFAMFLEFINNEGMPSLPIVSNIINLALMVIILVNVYDYKRVSSQNLKDYRIESVDSTTYLYHRKLVSYADKYMNHFFLNEGYFQSLYNLQFIIEKDSASDKFKNIYDSLSYNLNTLIVKYDSIKYMSLENDSIVGKLLYVKLKQDNKSRYAILFEYNDSTKIVNISRDEFKGDSDSYIENHPLLVDFNKKFFEYP